MLGHPLTRSTRSVQCVPQALPAQALLLASVLGWGFFYWEPTQVWVRELLESWQVLQAMLNWMNTLGVPDL